MARPPSLRSSIRGLVFVLAAAALVLLAIHTLAERRAEEAAMSAELLAPTGKSAPEPVASAPAVPPNPAAVTAETERGAGPEASLPPSVPSSNEGGSPIVPPELEAAIVTGPAPTTPSGTTGLDPALFSDWTTYVEAVKRSRETDRPVMLAFTTSGCETCESLRESVFEDEAASVTMRSAVIPVAVQDAFADTGAEERLVQQLQHDFDVTTFPTLIVWSPVTKRVRKLKGYRGAAATLRFIVDAASAVN